MILLRRLFPRAPAAIQIELTAQLLSGSGGLGLVCAIAGGLSAQAALNRDCIPASLLLMISLVALTRLMELQWMRRVHGKHLPNLLTSQRCQLRYGLGSCFTSLLLGISSLHATSYRDPALTLLVTCALCCYVFSLILRTAVRPFVCLPSIMLALVPTIIGLLSFLTYGTRLSPAFALMALATIAIVMVVASFQLTSHLYRSTLNQLLAQRDLVQFARRDPLTGLNNRLALREQFEALSFGSTRPAALLYLDLDKFKSVNDVHGHQIGDALLREVASRMASCLRSGDEAFRIGGDEFVVLLPHVQQRSDATAMARQLLAALSGSYKLDHATVRTAASIGIALADTVGADLDDVAAAADAALYDAKRNGRGTFRFANDPTSRRLIA